MRLPLALEGLGEVASRYEGFIVDLWGVVHDGVQPYPGAARTLRHLMAQGARVVLLSNAPRRAAAAAAALDAMGIDASHYSAILTSGEAVRTALLERTDPFFAALGPRFFHLGPARDANVYAGLDTLTRVGSLAEADWILNTGPDDLRPGQTLEDFEALLADAAARSLPMVCANPDLVVIRGGQRLICAGLLAGRYRELGGQVAMRGKPDPAIYRPVLELLGSPHPQRVLAIGDALATDIQGAQSVGIDALWVLGGIHAEALGLREGELAAPAVLAREAAKVGLAPRYAMARFVWDGADA